MEKNLIAKADLDILYANPSFWRCATSRAAGSARRTQLRTARRSSMRCIRTSAMPGPTRASCLACSYIRLHARHGRSVPRQVTRRRGSRRPSSRRRGPNSMRCSTSCATRARSSRSCRTGSTSGPASAGAFAFEVMNRGGAIADADTHKPTDDGGRPGRRGARRTGRSSGRTGSSRRRCISYTEAACIDAFRSGRYVFSPQQPTTCKQFNDPQKSAQVAGKISFLPYQGQSWGMIDSALY